MDFFFQLNLELELELERFIFHRKQLHLHFRKIILSFSSLFTGLVH